MGFPRQDYWSGLPFPSPGDLPNPGVKPTSPALAGKLFYTDLTKQPQNTGSKKMRADSQIIRVGEFPIPSHNVNNVIYRHLSK